MEAGDDLGFAGEDDRRLGQSLLLQRRRLSQPQLTLVLFAKAGEDDLVAARSEAKSQSTLTEKKRSRRNSTRRCWFQEK